MVIFVVFNATPTLCRPAGCVDWLFLLFSALPPPWVSQPGLLIGYFCCCCFQGYPPCLPTGCIEWLFLLLFPGLPPPSVSQPRGHVGLGASTHVHIQTSHILCLLWFLAHRQRLSAPLTTDRGCPRQGPRFGEYHNEAGFQAESGGGNGSSGFRIGRSRSSLPLWQIGVFCFFTV